MVCGIGEVLLDVGLGAEQAFLFPAPQCDADGAIHVQVEGFEDAHGFDHDGAAGGVVGGSGAAVPGIEMARRS